MSIALTMIRLNLPLSGWKKFNGENRGVWSQKEDTRKMAAIILRQCSHSDVVELIAKEFNSFPERLRIDFRTLASQPNSASGNVRKGLQKLNEKLNGALLREEFQQTFNRRVETVDGVRYKRIKVDEAKAAAQRKYGIIGKP